MKILTKDGKPFMGNANMDPAKIILAVESGVWTEKDLNDRGLVSCATFVVPDGKQAIGEAKFVQVEDGTWTEIYDLEDMSLPIEKTPEELFESRTGVSIKELQEMLQKCSQV